MRLHSLSQLMQPHRYYVRHWSLITIKPYTCYTSWKCSIKLHHLFQTNEILHSGSTLELLLLVAQCIGMMNESLGDQPQSIKKWSFPKYWFSHVHPCKDNMGLKHLTKMHAWLFALIFFCQYIQSIFPPLGFYLSKEATLIWCQTINAGMVVT